MKFSSAVVLLLFLFACKSASVSDRTDGYSYVVQKTITATNGAVVSAHPLAGRIGVQIMQQGGNAFDAVIATQLALAVVYPGAGNIGGGGFMVARLPDGKFISLDFRETAPALAHKDMYLDSAGNVLPNRSTRGSGSAGVPGTVAGLFETMKYAKLSFRELIQPAIELAANGFAITPAEATVLNSLQEELNTYNSFITRFHRKLPWKGGDTLIQPELAATLVRIRDGGQKGFYEGMTAQLITDQAKADGGYIGMEDLRNYKAIWRSTRRFTYKDLEIVTMDLPSSGGILLQQMFTMIEGYDVNNHPPLSSSAVQLMTEVERRAYADRAHFLGDPDFVQVPVSALTDKTYLTRRMQDFVPGVAGNSTAVQAGVIPRESEETTHISIIDKEGNAVALTTTLNDSYGSKTVVQGAGFLLNNEMDDFSIKPGEPNLYGAIGGEANAIAPRKRMLSSMAPTIVMRNNKPFLVVGTPGGTTIPTSVFQTIINIVDFRLPPEQAVNTPRFHHQWLPDEIFVERRFPDSTVAAMTSMGYRVSRRSTIGRTELIVVREDGTFEGVADIRGDDHAEGF